MYAVTFLFQVLGEAGSSTQKEWALSVRMVIFHKNWTRETGTFFLVTEIGYQGGMGKHGREMKWKLRIGKGKK